MNKMKTIVVKRSKQRILKAANAFCARPLSFSLATCIKSLVRFALALLWGKFVASLLFEPHIIGD